MVGVAHTVGDGIVEDPEVDLPCCCVVVVREASLPAGDEGTSRCSRCLRAGGLRAAAGPGAAAAAAPVGLPPKVAAGEPAGEVPPKSVGVLSPSA